MSLFRYVLIGTHQYSIVQQSVTEHTKQMLLCSIKLNKYMQFVAAICSPLIFIAQTLYGQKLNFGKTILACKTQFSLLVIVYET